MRRDEPKSDHTLDTTLFDRRQRKERVQPGKAVMGQHGRVDSMVEAGGGARRRARGRSARRASDMVFQCGWRGT